MAKGVEVVNQNRRDHHPGRADSARPWYTGDYAARRRFYRGRSGSLFIRGVDIGIGIARPLHGGLRPISAVRATVRVVARNSDSRPRSGVL